MLPFPQELYFHREHTWVRQEGANLYRLGVDEILLRDMRGFKDVDLPNEGDEISQDEICGMIHGKGIRRPIFAPLSGEIVEVNQDLYEDPTILVEDPYGIGWLLLLDPSDPQEELEYLLRGDQALDWWKMEIQNRKTNNPPNPQP